MYTRYVLQRIKVANGAQCMGRSILDSTMSEIRPKSPAGRGHLLKEERRGQSAASGYALPQQAAERAYLPEKG